MGEDGWWCVVLAVQFRVQANTSLAVPVAAVLSPSCTHVCLPGALEWLSGRWAAQPQLACVFPTPPNLPPLSCVPWRDQTDLQR